MTVAADLVAFLNARLDEDKQVARAAVGTIGEAMGWAEIHTAEMQREQSHAERHSPERVLAEVDAKRRILTEHSRISDRYCRTCDYAGEQDGQRYGCTTLRVLTLPYADHPDYRPDWAPGA